MKVLIVEDNKILLESVVEELSKHFETEKCEDGEEALYLVNQNIYDLVILLRTNGKIKERNGLEFKSLYLDTLEKRVYIEKEEIKLQNKQFNLLEYFVLNKGSILLKEQIYDRIWGIDSDATIEIVEVYVSNLRKKLSKYGYDKYIKTKRKVGYIFDDK